MANMTTRADRPDYRTAEDLRSGVQDLAESMTEPGLARTERLTRARVAAEASRNVAAAVQLLDPYRDGTHSRLRDNLLASVESLMDVSGRDDAEDRLARYATARAVAPTSSGQLGNGGLVTPGPGLAMPSPFGGTHVEPIGIEATRVAPWLLEYGILSDQPTKNHEGIQPEAWENLPEPTINPAFPLESESFTIAGEPLVWDQAARRFSPSRQVLDWPAFANVFEEAWRTVVLRDLEIALIARLLGWATVAATFKAAESTVGKAWTGGTGPDLVLTSSGDLPKVRRLYATENLTDPTMRPRILATAGVPDGTALVLVSAAVNVRRTDLSIYTVPAPSTLSVDAGMSMDGAVSLRKWGTVAKVDVAALDTDPVPEPTPRA